MIERLRLRNFRRFQDATATLRPGLNLIEGPNNAGKTTLFFAVEYALFGRVESFKTLKSLVHPGKRSLGVELEFKDAAGARYRLQRIHQAPPKGKKTLDGYFTLKALGEDGERYLLASDFGDTEDKLALKLQELTGLSRRLFAVALHLRQGEIATILDGAPELDMVLGVTAAAIAEDELRQMALELEKEAAGLPVHEERLRAIENELAGVAGAFGTLNAERQSAADALAALGESADPRAEFNRRMAPVVAAIAEFDDAQRKRDLASERYKEATEQLGQASASGVPDAAAALAKLESASKARVESSAKLQKELADADAKRRELDQQRGDLAGRLARRTGLPSGKGAKCEVCGAAINAAQVKKETAEWKAEVADLDKSLAAIDATRAKLIAALEANALAERTDFETATQLRRHQALITEFETSFARRQAEFDRGNAGVLQAYAKAASTCIGDPQLEPIFDSNERPISAIAALRAELQNQQNALAERVGQQMAQRQSLADLLKRFDAQLQTHQKRHTDLEREQATARAAVGALKAKALRAERFRRLSAGFKEAQVRIRSEAAVKLAEATLSIYRQLTDRDEFESLTIDPTKYSVHVVPRDLAEEVPAALYEGGGTRLLLGLAFRLAVARLVGTVTFLLLDEPTDGLDAGHRAALMERIGGPDLASQILLITHHASDLPGQRLKVARRDRESIVDTAM